MVFPKILSDELAKYLKKSAKAEMAQWVIYLNLDQCVITEVNGLA